MQPGPKRFLKKFTHFNYNEIVTVKIRYKNSSLGFWAGIYQRGGGGGWLAQ